MFSRLYLFQCPFYCRPESYAKADINPSTGKHLDVGISGLEPPGHAKNSDGFFEKGVLMASESMHASNGNIHEIKVIGNGHCHGISLALHWYGRRNAD
jgi:hypothetical protein